jgi:hypothetical protein
VRPDVVLIDPDLDARERLERLLRAHPVSAAAQVWPITRSAELSMAEADAEVERIAHLVAA